MHEEATAIETDRVIHRNQLTIGSVDANADAPRIHDHRAFLGQNGVSADRRRILWATHRRREHPRLSPVRSVVRHRAGSPGLTTEDIDAPDEPTKATGLWSRLNWHVSGRRSGYSFLRAVSFRWDCRRSLCSTVIAEPRAVTWLTAAGPVRPTLRLRQVA